MTTFLPHYTPTDIQAVKDISVWAAATCRSTQALATMIGGGNGTLSKVLRGGYTSSPSPILARVLRAAGQRLPDGWDALLPAATEPDPDPEPVFCVSPAQARPAMTAWEPGATLASVAGERRQILKALAKHSSQAPLQRDALLKRLGDTPEVRLALTFDDRISFILTEKLELKRLAFLDVIKEEAERQAEAADMQMEADFALMSGELSRLIPALVDVLGGEVKETV